MKAAKMGFLENKYIQFAIASLFPIQGIFILILIRNEYIRKNIDISFLVRNNSNE
jgi:hypothetical protein